MSRHKRKGSTTEISSKMSQIEDRLETGLGEIRNQLGTAIATGTAQKNPDLLKQLTDKLNELENCIKSSLAEVKKEMHDFLDMQKKRFNENGVAFFGIQEGDTSVLPETMAKFITSKFNFEVTVADINYCYRMGASSTTSTSSRADRSKRPRPVAVFFVNRWLRDRVFYAKSVLKGSAVMLCELLSDSVLQLYKQAKLILGAKNVWTRRDHSIHTTRLWSVNESKKMANMWNVKGFFKVTQGDIADCLKQLNGMKLIDHTLEIEKGGLDVHVQVCALMRAKLVSEVKENMQKLKETPQQCVEGLACVCRTICLANLKMIFPKPSYWKQPVIEGVSEKPSEFVEKYLNQILVPVLEATEDYDIANMILTLVCESWLDHIYTNKIKFSEHGACQLLCDFASVTAWLTNCLIVSETMRKKLLKNEILKRCEGVGRLLLRCPGEKIKMADKNKRKVSVTAEVNDAEKSELMPAEMYVPNQEQWLTLRAARKTLFPAPACCGKYENIK